MLLAKPIWIKDKENEMNIHAVFKTKVAILQKGVLRIATTAFYRVFVNGKFLAAGPARAAKGYVREDNFSLEQGNNEIIIEAVGYHCCSLSTVCQTSFLLAEVCDGNVVNAYTGRDFEGFLPECKIQKVERYSVQRHFTEIWDFRDNLPMTDVKYKKDIVCVNEKPTILERRAEYPLYKDIKLSKVYSVGNFYFDENLPYKERRYSWAEVPKEWGLFDWEEIPHPYTWIQRQKQIVNNKHCDLPITLSEGEFVIFDFGKIKAGFIMADLFSINESDIIIAFNEDFNQDAFYVPQRMNVHNVIECLLHENCKKTFQSFEPYTSRTVMIAVRKGKVKIDSVGIKTYMFNISNYPLLNSNNKLLNLIYKAALNTFAHNSVDLYSDCPSRERAGWLCDSYFTAKSEYKITNATHIEDAFLENYRLFENTGEYPEGVLPQCYPSDYPPFAGHFIPQWTMWYILEVEEYINKRGHKDMAKDFKNSIYGLLKFYHRFENSDGLLENIEGWNFVEWSKANEWTNDVNYPTQFLYAQTLESVYKIYGDEECLERAQNVRKVAENQSFNGTYFCDHSIRDKQGNLKLQTNHSSEACQYYAILFGNIDINSSKYFELKKLVLNAFSPKMDKECPEIIKVNAFIGLYLRMETLLKMKKYELLLSEVESFFGKMEECSGTLWEYRDGKGSKDHGFASYVLAVIVESLDALGECKYKNYKGGLNE